jgi:hypothetical protein
MTSLQFENLAKEVTKLNIQIFEPENSKDLRWSSYFKYNGILKPSTVYGIKIGENIDYNFKTTKKVETFFKSFINQHINKYEMKQGEYKLINGQVEFIKPKKEAIIKNYTSDRVSKYHYYTTLYGIGMFAFFTKDIVNATIELAKYLKSKGINYTNEYSDAGWAYRFVIGDKVEAHNKLLENFNLQ